MKILKRAAAALLIVLALSAAGFFIWAGTPYQPAPEALAALESDSQVDVSIGDYISFAPVGVEPTTAFVFYPGGRVDYRAYAAPLRQIAAQGYLVVLLRAPLNFAIFDVSAADVALAGHPEIENWVVGGHSLGGVASAMYAKDHLSRVDGVIFWASYPADASLLESDLKILSIYGTRDMAGMEKFQETEALLPAAAQYVVIEGGNHSQFGDYGFQSGDNEADISRADQQAQIVAATVNFLKEFGH